MHDEDAVQERAEIVTEALRIYVGTKIIQARPMTEVTFLAEFKSQAVSDSDPIRPGYLVIYPDGYKSWSPMEVFETAYREITGSERELIG